MKYLREIFKETPPEVPKFPYWVLVRLPLVTLVGFLGVILTALACRMFKIPLGETFVAVVGIISLSVLLVGILQIVAVPFALWVLLGIERWKSPAHWMAVMCGSVYLWFCWYYFYISISSYVL